MMTKIKEILVCYPSEMSAEPGWVYEKNYLLY